VPPKVTNVTADPYSWRWVAYHLAKAGRKSDLRRLLLNFDYLLGKLEATETNAFTGEYDYLPEDANLHTVQSVLRQSAHILAGSPRELPGQLIGRLPGSFTADIDALRSQASKHKGFRWLRPLGPSLTPLAASLIRTLQCHTDSVRAVAVTPDGRHVVSDSHDKTLRVWDLATGRTKRKLGIQVKKIDSPFSCLKGQAQQKPQSGQGHTGLVSAVAVTPDGRHVVSGSHDNTLRVWDLKDGKEILTFTVDGELRACIVAQDNRTIVAGDGFGRVHFLQLVEADPTKPAPGDAKIQLLQHKEQARQICN
jgi:WD40 repeat protein